MSKVCYKSYGILFLVFASIYSIIVYSTELENIIEALHFILLDRVLSSFRSLLGAARGVQLLGSYKCAKLIKISTNTMSQSVLVFTYFSCFSFTTFTLPEQLLRFHMALGKSHKMCVRMKSLLMYSL